VTRELEWVVALHDDPEAMRRPALDDPESSAELVERFSRDGRPAGEPPGQAPWPWAWWSRTEVQDLGELPASRGRAQVVQVVAGFDDLPVPDAHDEDARDGEGLAGLHHDAQSRLGDGTKMPYRSLNGVGCGVMEEKMYSVEEVAERLGLHVRTVRGYIRSGRLKAVRIGKQYRISPADLGELTGRPAAAGVPQVEVSSVVQVDGLDRTAAERLSTVVVASVNGVREPGQPQVQTVYDEERGRMKIVVLGGAAATADVLQLIDAVVDGEGGVLGGRDGGRGGGPDTRAEDERR
jgi:excisionase family DNA binding protein